MIIALDFDGTVVEHEHPEIGPPVPGAITWLQTLITMGARIILWTCRGDKELQDAVRYLEKNNIQLFGVNGNPEQHWTSSPKAFAHVYVDDRGLGVPLIRPRPGAMQYVDWSKVGPMLSARMDMFQ